MPPKELVLAGPPGPPPPPAKGKAKAAPPPPCKAKAKVKAKSCVEAADDVLGSLPSARLVNLHWRASLEPKDNEISATADPYLGGVVDFLPKWGQCRVDRCEERLSRYERSAGLSNSSKTELDDPDRDETGTSAVEALVQPSHRRRGRRHTIFSAECPVEELPQHKLQEFFQARAASFNISSRASCSGVSTLINDAKHRQIIDILVRKEAILRHPKQPQQVGVDLAVDELIDALYACDYSRVTSAMMEDFRKVASAHMEDKQGQNVLSFVEAHGEAALQRLEHPHLHRLLYGVLRIPAITARLECMVLEGTFSEHLEHCLSNLEVLRQGFQCLLERLDPLRSFFAAALRLGNALNRDSRAQVAGYGFKLCSLPKFLELRLPVRKEVSLFHFVILWMRPDEVDALCQPEAIEALQRARAARTYTVYQDLLQQLDCFRHIQQLVSTGRYKGQEIPRHSRPSSGDDGTEAPAVAEGAGGSMPESVFHSRMSAFAEQSGEKMRYVWRFGQNMFKAYMELGTFLDDFKAVYPPPKEDQDDKKDIFAVFHQFFTTVAKARSEVREQRLDRDIETALKVRVPYSDSGCAPPADGAVAAPPLASPLASTSPGGAGSGAEVDAGAGREVATPAAAADAGVAGTSPVPSGADRCFAALPPLPLPAASASAAPAGGAAGAEDAAPAETADALGAAPADSGGIFPKTPCSPLDAAQFPKSPLRRTPGVARRHLEVNWALSQCEEENSDEVKSPSQGLVSEVPPGALLGPPPKRPIRRVSMCGKPSVRPLPPKPAEPLAADATRAPVPRIKGVLGAPPLGEPLPLSPQSSSDGLPVSPALLDKTPSSPRTRLGRKSLTRIANRVTSEAIGDDGDGGMFTPCGGSGLSSPVRDVSPTSYYTGSENGEDCLDGATPDLQTQIWKEVKRRKSRGRAGTPSVWPDTPPRGVWAELQGQESPLTPPPRYPLTPVKEQGETPYRLARWRGATTPT